MFAALCQLHFGVWLYQVPGFCKMLWEDKKGNAINSSDSLISRDFLSGETFFIAFFAWNYCSFSSEVFSVSFT